MKKIVLALLIALSLSLVACSGSGEWDETSTISVYTRDTSSGTRAGFMSGIDFSEAAESDDVLVEGFVIKDNTGIISSVETDEYGIGYVSLASYDPDVVKGVNYDGVAPSITNVVNDSYGLKRPFNYVTRAAGDYLSETEEAIVEAFVAFMGTTDAADIITEEGAVPLATTESWDDIKADYAAVCDLDNSSITIKFGGSDSLESIAMALSAAFSPKCGNFVAEHDHTGSSDGFKRTQGSEKDGDNYKSIGFASRPFKDSEAGEAGSQGQLAWDAIVVIVNKANLVDSLTDAQLKKIYSGDFTTWEDLLA